MHYDEPVALYLHRRSQDQPPQVGVLVEYTGDDTLARLGAGIPPQARHVAGLFLGEALPKQPGAAACQWSCPGGV